jgi:hypothetical protein
LFNKCRKDAHPGLNRFSIWAKMGPRYGLVFKAASTVSSFEAYYAFFF